MQLGVLLVDNVNLREHISDLLKLVFSYSSVFASFCCKN